VLEHIEPQLIDNVIEHLISKFNKKALLIISLKESKTILPDGNNAHLIVKPYDWWIEKIKPYCNIEHIEFTKQKDLLINLTKEEKKWNLL
tara:strand:- start:221 stop:490 length:270 start_codon:yes stop_codon:yes gene_type:complete